MPTIVDRKAFKPTISVSHQENWNGQLVLRWDDESTFDGYRVEEIDLCDLQDGINYDNKPIPTEVFSRACAVVNRQYIRDRVIKLIDEVS